MSKEGMDITERLKFSLKRWISTSEARRMAAGS
ncbi:hypothetical protein JOC78_001370 [Bacillus ectoiniformans]|nr:hypothetical protein [Bacillus ectoiniformans]